MSAIKVSWEKSKIFTILTLYQYAVAIFFACAIFLLPSTELKIAVGSLVVAFASIASSNMLNLSEKKDREAILEKLSNIEKIQQEMQSEQREQTNSGPPIVASLQAMSEYYLDFISKQKGKGEKQ